MLKCSCEINKRKVLCMKTKVIEKTYPEVLSLIEERREHRKKHKKPKRPNILFRTLMKLVSLPDMWATNFRCEKIGMDRLKKGEPCFILMNHSSFIDLEIAASALYPMPFNIVASIDAFFGKNWLMRQLGCIPSNKFVSDATMVRDVLYAVKKKKTSVLMYPEAGYSFDGTSTTLPDSIGKCVKMLGVPLVMLKTYGAFSRDPLYNMLQRRRVNVSARVQYLLSAEEIAEMSDGDLTEFIKTAFFFDGFRWQKENSVRITEKTRADGLHRVLYKCPKCKSEGKMLGEGITLKCTDCSAEYTLDEFGTLKSDTDTEFSFVSDWFKWQRECVREELLSGKYSYEGDVDILISIDTKRLYSVGEGRLTHNEDGFRLTGCQGELDYSQKPLTSHSVYADLNWYEIGDMISVGDGEKLFYCFPKDKSTPVAKLRLAAEELYKIKREELDGEK